MEDRVYIEVDFDGTFEQFYEFFKNFSNLRAYTYDDPFDWRLGSEVYTGSKNMLFLWDKRNNQKTLAFIKLRSGPNDKTLLTVILGKNWKTYEPYWSIIYQKMIDEGWVEPSSADSIEETPSTSSELIQEPTEEKLKEIPDTTPDIISEAHQEISEEIPGEIPGTSPEIIPKSPEDITEETSITLPHWFPKDPETIKKWKMMYKIIQKTRKQYRKDFDSGKADNPKPSIDDLRDAIAAKLNEKPSERIVYYVKKAGDKGWLTD